MELQRDLQKRLNDERRYSQALNVLALDVMGELFNLSDSKEIDLDGLQEAIRGLGYDISDRLYEIWKGGSKGD